MTIAHDHHIHTIYSGHSAGDMVVGAIVRQAEEAGLRRIVVLEHVPDVDHDTRQQVVGGRSDLRRRPQIDAIAEEVRRCRGSSPVRLLVGAEVDADPVNRDGRLLLDDLSGVDVVLASTHFTPGDAGVWFEMPSGLPEPQASRLYGEWMRWIMHVAANPNVDVLAHPGVEMAVMGAIPSFSGTVLDDFEKLLQVCRKYETAFELNETVVRKMGKDLAEGYVDVIRLARDIGVKISIGSDAHSLAAIGEYGYVAEVVERLGLGPEHYFHPVAGKR